MQSECSRGLIDFLVYKVISKLQKWYVNEYIADFLKRFEEHKLNKHIWKSSSGNPMALKRFLSGPWQNASVSSTLGLGNSCGRQAWGDQVILGADCPVSTRFISHGSMAGWCGESIKSEACSMHVIDARS